MCPKSVNRAIWKLLPMKTGQNLCRPIQFIGFMRVHIYTNIEQVRYTRFLTTFHGPHYINCKCFYCFLNCENIVPHVWPYYCFWFILIIFEPPTGRLSHDIFQMTIKLPPISQTIISTLTTGYATTNPLVTWPYFFPHLQCRPWEVLTTHPLTAWPAGQLTSWPADQLTT